MQYEYQADQKETVWSRITFSVEANSQEEADKLAIEIAKKGSYYDDVPNAEYDVLVETTDSMTVEENDGNSTLELTRYKEKEIIYENGNKQTSDNSQD